MKSVLTDPELVSCSHRLSIPGDTSCKSSGSQTTYSSFSHYHCKNLPPLSLPFPAKRRKPRLGRRSMPLNAATPPSTAHLSKDTKPPAAASIPPPNSPPPTPHSAAAQNFASPTSAMAKPSASPSTTAFPHPTTEFSTSPTPPPKPSTSSPKAPPSSKSKCFADTRLSAASFAHRMTLRDRAQSRDLSSFFVLLVSAGPYLSESRVRILTFSPLFSMTSPLFVTLKRISPLFAYSSQKHPGDSHYCPALRESAGQSPHIKERSVSGLVLARPLVAGHRSPCLLSLFRYLRYVAFRSEKPSTPPLHHMAYTRDFYQVRVLQACDPGEAKSC